MEKPKDSRNLYSQKLLKNKSLDEIEKDLDLVNLLLNSNYIKKLSNNEISNLIYNAFCEINSGDKTKNLYISSFLHFILPGRALFRVRVIDSPDKIKCKRDVLNPPDSYAQLSRLNNDGESVLYASYDENTAKIETNIQSERYYVLTTLKTTKAIKTASLGIPPNPPYRDKDTKTKIDLINNFLCTLLTKRVEEGTDGFEYRLSNLMIKYFFKLDDKICGYYYPSVASPDRTYNVCLQPDKVNDFIKIHSVKIFDNKDINKEPIIIDTSTSEWI